jgi:hypothetical protein
MSFYVEYKTKAVKGKPFGEHHRATIYNGFPDYNSIISIEASGEHIDRVSDSQEERGKLLVLSELVPLVSAVSYAKWSQFQQRMNCKII